MKVYNSIGTNIPYYWFPRVTLPWPLHHACIRQLSQNWSIFTEGDPASFEIMNAINLTRILVGEQYGDPVREHQRTDPDA